MSYLRDHRVIIHADSASLYDASVHSHLSKGRKDEKVMANSTVNVHCMCNVNQLLPYMLQKLTIGRSKNG